jgi:hypothetical protein
MKKYLFLLAFGFMLGACTENNVNEFELDPSDLVIKAGTICGWCAQNDTLIISGQSFRYVNYVQCNTTNPSVRKTGRLAAAETELLLKKLDFSEFKKLDLNSCNVCVDGCDDWITITQGSETHSIRFGRNDSKLQSIQAFVDQLNALKSKYSGND